MPAAAKPSISVLHSAWAIGHIVVLLASLHTFFGLVTFKGLRKGSYLAAYSGALLSWGIVVYKSLGPPQFDKTYFRAALLDENVQYLVLALYWYLQKPIALTLVPFATFSLFHTLTFVRTTLLPKPPAAAPKPKAGAAAGATAAPKEQVLSGGQKASRTLQTWVKSNYAKAMLFVAFVEVVGIFSRVLFGALLFRNSFLAPLFFAHFLRLRYYLSPPTQEAFKWVNAQVDKGLAHPSVPAGVKKGVETARELIIRYADTALSVGQPPAPAAGAAPPPAAAR